MIVDLDQQQDSGMVQPESLLISLKEETERIKIYVDNSYAFWYHCSQKIGNKQDGEQGPWVCLIIAP